MSVVAVRPRTTRAETTTTRVSAVSLDWVLMFAAAGLLAAGALLVWSATSTRSDLTAGDSSSYFKHQLVNIAIGVVLGVMVAATDHRWVRILAPLVYVASIIGLVLVLLMGSTINGSRSWIMIGGLSIQPAEFAKLAVVIGMALLVAERTEGSLRTASWGEVGTTDVVGMLLIAGLPALLILLQPDLGTMLVLSATVFGVLAVAGVRRTWLLGLLTGAVAVATVAIKLHVLKAYQLDRFMAFTNPELDPRGAGYNTTQARIAIGNGGIFGQGLFGGSQTKSGFVPEQHTDFIFTVAGEELGLVGSAVLIALLGVVLWRALRIAMKADDLFGRVAAAGIACWFGFQAFQNIGMCLGIMPVTGVPLPLVSYGGSSMFASLMAIGLLQNIHLRSREALGVNRTRLHRSRF
jgi:rod shape determining protein RodA